MKKRIALFSMIIAFSASQGGVLFDCQLVKNAHLILSTVFDPHYGLYYEVNPEKGYSLNCGIIMENQKPLNCIFSQWDLSTSPPAGRRIISQIEKEFGCKRLRLRTVLHDDTYNVECRILYH